MEKDGRDVVLEKIAELARENPRKAVQVLRDETFEYLEQRILPRKDGKGTRIGEEEFCRRLKMILDRVEEKLQTIEKNTEENYFGSSLNTGINYFRKWMNEIKYYSVSGQPGHEWHASECPDQGCLGYCSFMERNERASLKVFREDFQRCYRKDGSSKVYVSHTKEKN